MSYSRTAAAVVRNRRRPAGAGSGRWVRRLALAAVAVTVRPWKGDAMPAVAALRAAKGIAEKGSGAMGIAARRAVRRLDLALAALASVAAALELSQAVLASAVPVLVAGDLALQVLVPALAVVSVRKDSVRQGEGRPWNGATTIKTTTAVSAGVRSGTTRSSTAA